MRTSYLSSELVCRQSNSDSVRFPTCIHSPLNRESRHAIPNFHHDSAAEPSSRGNRVRRRCRRAVDRRIRSDSATDRSCAAAVGDRSVYRIAHTAHARSYHCGGMGIVCQSRAQGCPRQGGVSRRGCEMAQHADEGGMAGRYRWRAGLPNPQVSLRSCSGNVDRRITLRTR